MGGARCQGLDAGWELTQGFWGRVRLVSRRPNRCRDFADHAGESKSLKRKLTETQQRHMISISETEALHKEDWTTQRELPDQKGSRRNRGVDGEDEEGGHLDLFRAWGPVTIAAQREVIARTYDSKSGGNSSSFVARLVPDVQGLSLLLALTGCPAAPTPHICGLCSAGRRGMSGPSFLHTPPGLDLLSGIVAAAAKEITPPLISWSLRCSRGDRNLIARPQVYSHCAGRRGEADSTG